MQGTLGGGPAAGGGGGQPFKCTVKEGEGGVQNGACPPLERLRPVWPGAVSAPRLFLSHS